MIELLPQHQFDAFCRKWRIAELLYVGEVHLDFDDDARDAHRFIAKFRPDARWGYFDVFDMEDELSRTLGVPVQILSRDGIKKGRESAFRIQDAAVLHRD